MTVPTEIAATANETTAEQRPVRHERHEHRDRERHEHRDAPRANVAAEAEAVASEEPTQTLKVAEIAHAADRADRGGKRRDKKTTAPTEETREFWETWADNKATQPAPEPAVAEAAEPEAAEARPARSARGKDEKRGGRDRGRGKRDEVKDDDAKPARGKKDDAPRGKRDTIVMSAAAAVDGNQARLFVNLGKKHGVTADQLRALLAGPVGGDTARIGSVSLRDTHAHVRVPEELVEAIIAGVHGTTHGEQTVTVERARA